MLSRIALRSICGRQPSLMWVARPSSSVAKTKSEERDLINFPRPVRLEEPGKVRIGFIPAEWFEMFYKKTGVTGPYALGIGFFTFMYSKEYMVMEHEFYAGLVVYSLIGIGMMKYGPAVAEWCDKGIAESDKNLLDYQESQKKVLKDDIAYAEHAQWQAAGQTMLFEAKKENIALQLEASYRQRLAAVHKAVKQRLDYQLETANVKTRIEQRHMVDWIVDNVRKSITPAQEAATLKQCLGDLKAIAARA